MKNNQNMRIIIDIFIQCQGHGTQKTEVVKHNFSKI